MFPSSKKNSGFTIIEMLMAICLMVMIAAAMGAFLFASVRAVEDLESTSSMALADTVFALEGIAHEIQSSPVVPEVLLKGESDQVSFPVLYSASDQDPLKTKFRLGQVQVAKLGSAFEYKRARYFFDSSKKALMRQVEDEEAAVILKKIKAAEFSYAIASSDRKSWAWKSSMSNEMDYKQLGAISIEVTPESGSRPDRPTRPIQRTFYMARYHPLEATLETSQAVA